MAKRIFIILSILIFILSSVAFAEDYSTMSESELIELRDQIDQLIRERKLEQMVDTEPVKEGTTLRELFPDLEFAKIIRDEMNLFTVDTVVSQEDLDTVTKISFPYNIVVYSLEGISHLRNLSSLEITYSVAWAKGRKYHDGMISENDYTKFAGTELPDEIGQLKNLRTIKILGGKFRTFPDSMRNLINLNTLSIQKSSLDELPYWIGEMTELRIIDLTTTNVSVIPPSIGNLVHLEKLCLCDTLVESLPEEIGKLDSLQVLDLSYSPLKALPESIGNLINLKTLDLQYTLLTTLPASIYQLKLKELDISNTGIE